MKTRATHGIHNLGRRPAKPAEHRRSTCKNCRTGLYLDQPAVWQRGQRPGLVHVDCNNPYGGAK